MLDVTKLLCRPEEMAGRGRLGAGTGARHRFADIIDRKSVV